MSSKEAMELLQKACNKESKFWECWNNLKDKKALKEHSEEKRLCSINYNNEKINCFFVTLKDPIEFEGKVHLY